MRGVVTVLAVLATTAPCAAVSCQKVGNFTYCSDGSSSQQVGNYTYWNDGSRSQRIGNYEYRSDGTRSQQNGGYIYRANPSAEKGRGENTRPNGGRTPDKRTGEKAGSSENKAPVPVR